MDPMLEKFFAEHEQNLQARRQQHREEVLHSLKLVTIRISIEILRRR